MTTTKLTIPTEAPAEGEAALTLPSEQHPAASTSVLSNLRAKREETRAGLFVDLVVPRWSEPEIYVRFGPADPAVLNKAMEQRKKKNPRPADWFVLAQADALVDACIGVFAVLDGQKYSLREGDENGAWTKFDADLAKNLGLDTSLAAEVVRGLFFTDADMISTMGRLAAWSGMTMPDADDDFLDS